jgi:hypothetical protein
MIALPGILPFPIVVSLIISLIISLIPLWTFADFAASAPADTFLFKGQSIWSEPIISLDCSFLFDKLSDDLIRRGGHHGVFDHLELQADFQLVVPWDSAKEVEEVLLLSHSGDCLYSVRIGISVGDRWPCSQIVILDSPIDPRCLIVDISAVL